VQLALLLLLGQTLSLSLEWVFLWRSVVRPRLTLDLGFCGRLLRSTLTFLGIDGIIAITSSVNVVLLSRFRTESEVGFYNAATQFLVPVALVLQSLVIGVVPAMCRRFGLTGESLSELTAPIVELMLALALPMAAGLCLLAAPAVSLLYGHGRLDPAVTALEVLAWGLIATALTSILGQVLVASLRERVALRIVLVDLAVSVVAGILLIPAFGFVGAAMAGLVTRVVDMTLHYLPVAREYPLSLLVRASWKPALATAVMAAYLMAAPARGLLIDVPAAAAIYLVTCALLLLAESGSPRRVKLHYAVAWRNL